VVGTLGALGLLAPWLAVLVVGRDGGQIWVTLSYRLSMFGGRWPGAAAFFDVDNQPARQSAAASDLEQGGTTKSKSSSSSDGPQADTAAAADAAAAGAPPDMPRIRPLFVSKLNTALLFLLAGGCVAQQWQGVPGDEALRALEAAVGATTAASGLAYLWLHSRGRLYLKR
jgi:cardiolipin synthase